MKFETKIKIADFYIKTRNYFFKGQSEFMVFKGIIQLFILIDLMLLARFGYKAPLVLILLAGVFVAVTYWAIGRWWDKHMLNHREAEYNNQRDLFVKEMRGELNGTNKRNV